MLYIYRKSVARHLVELGLIYPSELGPNSFFLADGVTEAEVASARANFALGAERRLATAHIHPTSVNEKRKRCS